MYTVCGIKTVYQGLKVSWTIIRYYKKIKTNGVKVHPWKVNPPNTIVLWFDKGCDLIDTVMRKRCPILSNAQATTQLPSPTDAGLQKTKICCQEGIGMAVLLERLSWVQCPTPLLHTAPYKHSYRGMLWHYRVTSPDENKNR